MQFFELNGIPGTSLRNKVVKVVVSYDVKEFMALATKKLEVAKRMLAATTDAEKAAPPLN